MRKIALALVGLWVAAASAQTRYDIVIRGGRVMDPETGLDGVRNVGIANGTIARITTADLQGTRTIDANGLVVAPGFIDLHSHGQDAENYRLKALDGVTTALELEIGVSDVAGFIAERTGQALVNFGATASHPAVRVATLGAPMPSGAIVPPAGPATDRPITDAQFEQVAAALERGLGAGALGIGMGLAYTPGTTRLEVIRTFRIAAAYHVPIYVHVRSSGRAEPGSSIESINEVIGAAAVTGAALHIVHINSVGLRDAVECLRLVEGARARGLDVTAEAYPYGAGMTAINSAFFNPGWQERNGITYKDVQLIQTGERLTKERFDRLHASPDPLLVLLYVNPDDIVDAVIEHPLTMIASDGEVDNGKGHPRGAGTYARILSRYVRERRTLTLMDALRKMSLMPAQRLESATASARRKGRAQEGADADLTIFDPATVQDHATYEAGPVPSSGFRHVLVAGTPVVDDGKIVESVHPGRAVTRSATP
jgi:N-acyl-D-aspartate/D-glutamate deacylase